MYLVCVCVCLCACVCGGYGKDPRAIREVVNRKNTMKVFMEPSLFTGSLPILINRYLSSGYSNMFAISPICGVREVSE